MSPATITTIAVEDLRAAVRAVSVAVAKPNTPIDVLRGLRFTPGRVAATNMEITALVDVEGLDIDCLVPAAAVRTALDSFGTSGQVEISIDGELHLTCGRVGASLPLMVAADYPELPKPFSGNELILPAEAVGQLLDVAAVASTDFDRPGITGLVLTWGEDGALTASATDSYRLYRWRGTAQAAGGGEVLFAPAALRAMPKGSEVTIAADGWGVTLRSQGLTVIARLIDARPIDADTMFPSKATATVRFTDESAAAVAGAAHAFRSGGLTKVSPIRMSFTEGSSDAEIQVRGDSMCTDVTAELAEPFESGAMEIGANPQFLADALEYAGPEVAFITPIRPMVFRRADEGREALLMPIRLNT